MSRAPLLVTGAAGFIGARFLDSLRERGLPFLAADHPEHFRTRPEHAPVDEALVLDREGLPERLRRERPELAGIVHLGACTDTTELDEAFLRRVNLEYSIELFRFATEAGIPFLYASSAATYGDGRFGYDDDPALTPKLEPLNPYGRSKLEFDLFALASEARGEAPPRWAGFRFFNVYGFGERHKGRMASVVLHAFDQIRSTGRVRLFRSHRPGIPDGHQRRDFVFVDDVVEVLHFALERPSVRGIYNLGTGRARTFLDLARATFRALGVEPDIEFIDTPPAIRDRYQYFTEARMERLRGAGFAKPFTPLEEGVAATVARLLEAAG